MLGYVQTECNLYTLCYVTYTLNLVKLCNLMMPPEDLLDNLASGEFSLAVEEVKAVERH